MSLRHPFPAEYDEGFITRHTNSQLGLVSVAIGSKPSNLGPVVPSVSRHAEVA